MFTNQLQYAKSLAKDVEVENMDYGSENLPLC